jgi:hypothetical protein
MKDDGLHFLIQTPLELTNAPHGGPTKHLIGLIAYQSSPPASDFDRILVLVCHEKDPPDEGECKPGSHRLLPEPAAGEAHDERHQGVIHAERS